MSDDQEILEKYDFDTQMGTAKLEYFFNQNPSEEMAVNEVSYMVMREIDRQILSDILEQAKIINDFRTNKIIKD